jgi:hypothetical protein
MKKEPFLFSQERLPDIHRKIKPLLSCKNSNTIIKKQRFLFYF